MNTMSIIVLVGLLSITPTTAQIKNSKTIQTKIYGNCNMCRSRIAEAGSIKNVVRVEWNPENKIASITYDSAKTTTQEIERRIALAGHDSDNFLAPDKVYDALPTCCRYDRIKKTVSVSVNNDRRLLKETGIPAAPEHQNTSAITFIFNHYLDVKEALVKSDAQQAAKAAETLHLAVKNIKMENLTTLEINGFSAVSKSIAQEARNLSLTNDLADQRKYFEILSRGFYELLKVTKSSKPVYLQHCPMYHDGKGADWLSREAKVINPYYGSEMLTCGKTIETIN
jgi:copper chaperone CopZ